MSLSVKSSCSDKVLVDACLAQDRNAWETLVARFRPLVVRVAGNTLARCGAGTSLAEDVAGDPGRARYNAFASSANYYDSSFGSLQGDHKHYSRNRFGELSLVASAGDLYVEACRMVRKDGFFRVAQDLRQEGLNNFPANYLEKR